MRNVWTLAKREFVHFFVSPVAYAVAGLVFVVSGLWFVYVTFALSTQGGEPSMSYTLNLFVFLILMVGPVLTMRLLADEQNKGTLELLLTAPIKEWELVLGKWLGAWFFGLCLAASTVIYMLILFAYSNPDPLPMYSAYLGVALFVGAILAIGVFTSSLTGNLIVAVAIGYAFTLAMWIFSNLRDFLQSILGSSSGAIGTIVGYIDINEQFAKFNRGVIDTSSIVFYISVIAIALFLATRVVESRRWR